MPRNAQSRTPRPRPHAALEKGRRPPHQTNPLPQNTPALRAQLGTLQPPPNPRRTRRWRAT
eukprot:2729840-Lingulodinium_polyedra.AAC.1